MDSSGQATHMSESGSIQKLNRLCAAGSHLAKRDNFLAGVEFVDSLQ